ncbi:DNA repair protein SWI5/SAE3 [Stagonosporopsis vannaccii]|nr:DNA repair protein SWI5/SAE3 [Stagonosporopsis vannaccii]
MAIATGVTEIADSEEEPLSSSPVAVSDADADKLSATARYDVQAMACPHQEPTDHSANEFSGHTDCLDADHAKLSSDLSITSVVDCLDMQPPRQQRDDNTSTSTTQANAKAVLPPSQASVDVFAVGQYSRGVGELGAESTLIDQNDHSRNENTFRLCEQSSPPADTNIKIDKVCEERCPPDLLKSSPLVPTGVNTEQTNTPVEHSQHDAMCNEPLPLEPANGDLAHAVSNIHVNVEEDVTAEPSQSNIEPADDEALTEGLSHEKGQEASDASQSFPGAHSSETRNDVSNALSSAADDPKDMDSDQPAPAGVAVSRTGKIQSDIPGALSARQDHNSAAKDTQAPVANPAVVPPSPAGGKLATDNVDRDRQDTSGSTVGVSAESNTRDKYEKRVEQTGKGGSNCARDSISDVGLFSSVPTDLPGQSRSETAMAEKVLKPVTQDSAMSVPVSSQDYPKAGNSQSLASTAVRSQTGSQFVALQARETTSQRPGTKISPQEITLAELKAQKAGLLASLKDLPAIQVLIEEHQTANIGDISDGDGEPTEANIMAAANKLVKDHIKLLHEYNELKDAGQGLMGLIADQRGVRIVEVQDEFGIDAND